MRPGGQVTIADDIDAADPYAVLGVACDADDALRRIGFRPDAGPAARGTNGRRDDPRRRGFRRR